MKSNSREGREREPRAGTYTIAQAAASGGMVAVVGAILLASWVLKAEPRPAPRHAPTVTGGAARTSVLAPMVDARPTPGPGPAHAGSAPSDSGDSLARRAMRDAGRLAGRRDAWTAQVAAVCSEESVAAIVTRNGGSDELYLLPITISDRSCFRVLWGTYDTAAAAAAADLPPALRGNEKPRALAVAGILP